MVVSILGIVCLVFIIVAIVMAIVGAPASFLNPVFWLVLAIACAVCLPLIGLK